MKTLHKIHLKCDCFQGKFHHFEADDKQSVNFNVETLTSSSLLIKLLDHFH